MQEEKIKKGDKIIKYGKISAIILIFLFTLSFITEGEFYFITIVLSVGFVFFFLELFSILMDYAQKLKKIIATKNIIFLLILLFILNFIYNQSIYYAFIAVLFILWFWIFREIFKSRRLRILVITIMILIPSIIFDYHKELYYRTMGKVVEKKIEVSAFYGIETAQSECENETPEKCKLIKWKKVGFSDYYIDCKNEGRSDCVMCWDCGYFIIDCFYGCSKSYSE